MNKDYGNLVKQMSLEEKASMCSGSSFWHLQGIERLNIPRIMVSDGPHGLRKQDMSQADPVGLSASIPATCYPTAVGMAATWNKVLIHKVGVALGEECQKEDVSVLLGPGANIKRSPLCGRNFEYFSEDPYLSGHMAKNWINGVQSQGVGVSLKHFAVNNQEANRMVVDVLVDERAFREIYLTSFEIAVKEANPWTLMCAYNKINGVYASENHNLLTNILRNEWHYQGLVMTDWGATNDRVEGIKAGLDLEMPGNGGVNDREIIKAIQSGALDETALDVSVERVVSLTMKARYNQKDHYKCDMKSHHWIAKEAAGESVVLLKNEASLLPLKKATKIGVIGTFFENIRYQGAGSSMINPTWVDQPKDFAQELFDYDILYGKGYDLATDVPNPRLLEEAIDIAKKVEVIVLMIGLTDQYESEGFDRTHMGLPMSHNALVEAVSQVSNHVVVVLANGSPVEMPWISQVDSVVELYLGGQAIGSVVFEVLRGVINPSGKLAETFPLRLEDCSASAYFPMDPNYVEYRESIFVGYRYYETVGAQVLFPFGHGLSYTTFSYHDLTLSQVDFDAQESITVTVAITNIGDVYGKEVVQLYISNPDATVLRPKLELKGFDKVGLNPLETKILSFTLDKRSFAYYDVEDQDFAVNSGTYEVGIGASVRDIRLSQKVEVQGIHVTEAKQEKLKAVYKAYHNLQQPFRISEEGFKKLYGRSIDQHQYLLKPYHRNSTFGQIRSHWLGKLVYSAMIRGVNKRLGDNPKQARMMHSMIKELPLRNMNMMGMSFNGYNTIDGFIKMLNGQFFRGVRLLLKKDK